MNKQLFLFALALACMVRVTAQTTQPCGTDEMHQKYLQQYPQIADFEQQLEKSISYNIAHHKMDKYARKTSTAHAWDDYYDIPVVVHVMHNYGLDYLSDNAVYNLIAEMNRFYSLQQDTTSV